MIGRITEFVARKLMHWFDSSSPKDRDHPEKARERGKEIEDIFVEIFQNRTREYILATIGLLSAILFFDLVLLSGIPEQSYGLSMNLLGAVILGRGLLVGKYDILLQSGTYVGVSLPLQRRFSSNMADAVWGIALLLFGFLIQVLTNFGISIPFN